MKLTDPSSDQTADAIEAYLRGLSEGDKVAVRSTQFGFLRFDIATVTGTNPKLGRVYTDPNTHLQAAWAGSAWYMKSGRSCHAPRGQSVLCIPTDAIKEHAAANPNGANPARLFG